jgi:CO/xanthine dehydrogenase FAD-binding subunit
MKAFQYVTATSPTSACELVTGNGRFLGGGIDLLSQMKEYLADPKILVNVKALTGLNKIEPGDKVWTFGANVTVAELEDHPGLKQTFPGLQQAAAEVGSRQIRNVATIGGNLAQHSRCWYYRHRDVLCLKKGGDTCYARHGDNKYHSLFTGNTCISPIVSNLAVILGALEATTIIQRGDKTLRMSIPELYAKAWDNPTAHHSLADSDLARSESSSALSAMSRTKSRQRTNSSKERNSTRPTSTKRRTSFSKKPMPIPKTATRFPSRAPLFDALSSNSRPSYEPAHSLQAPSHEVDVHHRRRARGAE